MSENIRVAIDGPSGAGKSTLARSVAARLNFLYVDTGAIYRTIGYAVWRKGIDPRDRSAVVAVLPDLEICLTYGTDGLQHMELNGMDVTAEIRLPEVSRYASLVSAYPEVRAYLLEMQRQLARENSVVMDGRDIGTVVLPDAEVKVFLTASAEERARRRMLELEERGTPEPYAAILRAIQERDWILSRARPRSGQNPEPWCPAAPRPPPDAGVRRHGGYRSSPVPEWHGG